MYFVEENTVYKSKSVCDAAEVVKSIKSGTAEKVLENGNYVSYNVLQKIYVCTERNCTRPQFLRKLVLETPDNLIAPVEPTWIVDVLEGRAEQEHVLIDNPDFLLMPDSKWNRTTMDQLYLLAICKDRTLRSLRDLRGEHIGLLETIWERGLIYIKETYGVDSDSILVYLHYPPSQWVLHVHFAHIAQDQGSIFRTHSLNSVVQNLRLDGDYYKNTDLEAITYV